MILIDSKLKQREKKNVPGNGSFNNVGMTGMFSRAYRGKNVLVTGDTGFKGGWLCKWLMSMPVSIFGIGLESTTQPSLFDQLNLERELQHFNIDIRNYDALKATLKLIKPDIIFHLAAQSLVRESYASPLETMQTNVLGTANLLEAVRDIGFETSLVCITSDKCYENREWLSGYRESDSMGGYDPYSASKGAAEIIISSWRRSFFNPDDLDRHGVKVASARAGNVIGGGDWAKERIVPDSIRFLQDKEPIRVRNPYATRPWQHVLEPLCGYLLLGAKLLESDNNEVKQYCDGFNVGPNLSSNRPVHQLVDEIINCWGEGTWNYKKEDAVHEASLLNLNIDKAYHLLGWQPAWDFSRTLKKTVEWYKEVFSNPDIAEQITELQINEYLADSQTSQKEFKMIELNQV